MLCIHAAEKHSELKALITIASRSHPDRFIKSYFREEEIGDFRDKGYFDFHDYTRLKKDFLEDAEKHETLEKIKGVSCPHLIIHGTNDKRVPISEARELFNEATDPKEIDIVEGADHYFSDEEHRKYLFETIISWLLRVTRY